MTTRYALILCAVLTVLFSLPSITKLPLSAAFLRSDVRSGAMHAMQELRDEGLWLVHVTLNDVTFANDRPCFHFTHTYRNRTGNLPSGSILICP